MRIANSHGLSLSPDKTNACLTVCVISTAVNNSHNRTSGVLGGMVVLKKDHSLEPLGFKHEVWLYRCRLAWWIMLTDKLRTFPPK